MVELTREHLQKFEKLPVGEGIYFGHVEAIKLVKLALKGLEAKKLTEQRDALLAALKDICDDVSVKLPEQLRRHNLQDMARAAIAAVEELS